VTDAGPIPPDELEVTVHARRDLAAEHEPELIASFLDRVGGAIDARVDERLAEQEDAGSDWVDPGIGVALGSVALGIPVTAVAGAQAELPGVIVAWIGIVLVNVLYWRSRRG